MGTRLPTPNALGDMRMMGQNWLRLYSLVFTSFSTLSTNTASNPCAFISAGPSLFSMY